MHIITSNPLSLLRLKTLVVEGSSIELSDELVQKIQNSRDYLDQKTSSFLTSILSSFRSEIPKVTEDRVLHNDIEKAIKFIQTLELENEVLFS
jgi:histidine ammonia-lyase